ncbi:hypothetical protein DSL72_005038 [Monilinia vaccinii-corymbosi]|uniref:DUF7371 domain-containing protein n=1 Tax=Monilinia vaccinii-corymbosi TaxID=61207 RepID=A0A8A3PEF8_9HELO|nr:hypothetical protein DSL72_005038 [Monilinia vaccinii-corymbosi]
MIAYLLLAMWVFWASCANAAPRGEAEASAFALLASNTSIVTVYLPCPLPVVDGATLVHSSDVGVVTMHPTGTGTGRMSSVVGGPQGTISRKSSVSSSMLTGTVDPASTTSSEVFSFMVVHGTTSWLNGHTPADPTQSFVVLTSSVTVVPLLSLPMSSSSSRSRSRSPSLSASSSESVIFSTVSVIPLSTVPATSVKTSSSSSTGTGSTSSIVAGSSGIHSNISSSVSGSGSSTGVNGASSRSITSSVSSSSNTGISSAVRDSSSSVPFVSSSTISKPAPIHSTTRLVSSTIASESASSSAPAITRLTTTRVIPLSTGNTPPTLSATSSSTSHGRGYTVASGGWDASSSSTSESSLNIYTSFTMGTLTTLTAAGGFKTGQPSTRALANLTTPVASLSSRTSSLSNQTSILTSTSSAHTTSTSSMISLKNAISTTESIPLINSTSTYNSISLSNTHSFPTMIPLPNTTLVTKSVPLVNSASVYNSASSFHAASISMSIPLSRPMMSSSLMPTFKATSAIIASSPANSTSAALTSPIIASSSTNSTSATPTSSTIVASATPSSCGERGDFVLTFDDVPSLPVSNASHTSDVQPEPFFNPYHQFRFSDGFTVAPPPKRMPFLPSSSPFLLEFTPNFNASTSNRHTGPNVADHGFAGQIGSADEGSTGCFNFNLYGASLGCDSQGPPCDFTFTGYSYDAASRETSQLSQQRIRVPACPELSHAQCTLMPIDLDPGFRDLSFFLVNVTVAGTARVWWMDDLRLGWADDTCEGGLCR